MLGFDVGASEDGAFWLSFLRSLVARGLRGVALVISDAHQGLRHALAAVLTLLRWRNPRLLLDLDGEQLELVSQQVVVANCEYYGGGMRIAPVANLCLTFDHRALDVAYAGAFLRRLREIIERRDWAAEL